MANSYKLRMYSACTNLFMNTETSTQTPTNIGPVPQIVRLNDTQDWTVLLLTISLIVVHFLQRLNRDE